MQFGLHLGLSGRNQGGAFDPFMGAMMQVGSGAQAAVNSSYSQEPLDTDGLLDASAGTLTIQKAAPHFLFSQGFASGGQAADTWHRHNIRKNGTQVKQAESKINGSSHALNTMVPWLEDLSVSDEIDSYNILDACDRALLGGFALPSDCEEWFNMAHTGNGTANAVTTNFTSKHGSHTANANLTTGVYTFAKSGLFLGMHTGAQEAPNDTATRGHKLLLNGSDIQTGSDTVRDSNPDLLKKMSLDKVGMQLFNVSAGDTLTHYSIQTFATLPHMMGFMVPSRLAGHCMQAYESGTSSAAGDVTGWSDELYDPAGAFDPTTGVWTCPSDGYYMFYFAGNKSPATPEAERQLLFTSTGANAVSEFLRHYAPSAGTTGTLSQVVARHCEAGDTAKIQNVHGASWKDFHLIAVRIG